MSQVGESVGKGEKGERRQPETPSGKQVAWTINSDHKPFFSTLGQTHVLNS